MAENALRWPMVDETYLEVVGCLGTALVVLLGGDTDFKIVDGFVTRLTLLLVNVKGLGEGEGGGRGAERTDGFKQVLPSDVTLGIVLAASEIFRHMLDFRSSMSCFGLG